MIDRLIVPHRFRNSVTWRLTSRGLVVDGRREYTWGPPETVARIWGEFGLFMEATAYGCEVPVELIVATAATETGGDADAVRLEPGYVSDEATPHKVSPGLMQTLISTAREAMDDPSIDRARLLRPANSIAAGTAYIAQQSRKTHFDPPKVAAAYNAGRLRWNPSRRNRWKMRQYPIGTGEHVDRFVLWFNDCFRFFRAEGLRPTMSFAALFEGASE